jgi:hypothetical protein
MKGRQPQEKDKYQSAAGAWALKHGKAIELFIHNGAKIRDKVDPTDFSGPVLGRKKQWEITKGKLGTHEGIKGEFEFYFEYGADIAADLYNTATNLGIITVKGAWASYDNGQFKFNAQGMPKAVEILRQDQELVDHLRAACFHASNLVYRHI